MNQDQTKDLVMQFQSYQQQYQSILIQKESLKMQIMETDKALEELENTKQENAFRITGQIMISKPVEELKNELKESKEAVEIRIKSLEKTEERVTNKLKELQEQLKTLIK